MAKKIEPVENKFLKEKIIKRLNDLTKPPNSLGRLEEFIIKYCLCRNNENAKIKNMTIFTFAADHGITNERVSPYPKEVTAQMVINMVKGGAAISVLCKNAGIKYYVVDMGVDADFSRLSKKFIDCKIAYGTKNFLYESALTNLQVMQAINKGHLIAQNYKADLYGIGEMGIGNSSSASALFSILLNISPKYTVGAGTGSAGKMLEHKKNIISKAVEFHKKYWNFSPLDALKRVGGLEIAAMVGFIYGAAKNKIPVVIDGFICSSAALIALKINHNISDYLFFSHQSKEKFHKQFLKEFKIRPILNLDMRLGEGTGAALAMQIIKQALNCYHQMATFSGAKISNKNI